MRSRRSNVAAVVVALLLSCRHALSAAQPLPTLTTSAPQIPSPAPTPQVLSPSPTPQVSPSPTPQVSPSPTPQVSPSPTPQVSPSPTPKVSPSPTPKVQSPSPTPQALSPSPTPQALSPAPTPQVQSPAPTPPPVQMAVPLPLSLPLSLTCADVRSLSFADPSLTLPIVSGSSACTMALEAPPQYLPVLTLTSSSAATTVAPVVLVSDPATGATTQLTALAPAFQASQRLATIRYTPADAEVEHWTLSLRFVPMVSPLRTSKACPLTPIPLANGTRSLCRSVDALGYYMIKAVAAPIAGPVVLRLEAAPGTQIRMQATVPAWVAPPGSWMSICDPVTATCPFNAPLDAMSIAAFVGVWSSAKSSSAVLTFVPGRPGANVTMALFVDVRNLTAPAQDDVGTSSGPAPPRPSLQAVINGPTAIGPCDALRLSGAGSTGLVAAYYWSSTLPGVHIESQGAAMQMWPRAPGTNVTVTLTVVGADATATPSSSSTTWTVQVLGRPVPLVSIDGAGTTLTVRAGDPLRLVSRVTPSTPCTTDALPSTTPADDPYEYAWAMTTAMATPPSLSTMAWSTTTPVCQVKAGMLRAGAVYVFAVQATVSGVVASASVVVRVVRSPLVAVIAGGGQTVSGARIALDASASFDPDARAAPLQYAWACTMGGTGAPCDPSGAVSLLRTPLLAFPPGFFRVAGACVDLAVRVNVTTGGAGDDDRWAVASTTVTVCGGSGGDVDAASVSVRAVPQACVDADSPMTMLGAVSGSMAASTRLRWQCNGAVMGADAMLTPADAPIAKVRPGALHPSTWYTCAIQLWNGTGVLGASSTTFRTCTPPTRGTVTVYPEAGRALADPFTICANGWSSPDTLSPLAYQFALVSADGTTTTALLGGGAPSLSNCITTVLPAMPGDGGARVAVRAMTGGGASALATANVTVLPRNQTVAALFASIAAGVAGAARARDAAALQSLVLTGAALLGDPGATGAQRTRIATFLLAAMAQNATAAASSSLSSSAAALSPDEVQALAVTTAAIATGANLTTAAARTALRITRHAMNASAASAAAMPAVAATAGAVYRALAGAARHDLIPDVLDVVNGIGPILLGDQVVGQDPVSATDGDLFTVTTQRALGARPIALPGAYALPSVPGVIGAGAGVSAVQWRVQPHNATTTNATNATVCSAATTLNVYAAGTSAPVAVHNLSAPIVVSVACPETAPCTGNCSGLGAGGTCPPGWFGARCDRRAVCVSYDPGADRWTDAGCVTVGADNTTTSTGGAIQCACTHLTDFSVELQAFVPDVRTPDPGSRRELLAGHVDLVSRPVLELVGAVLAFLVVGTALGYRLDERVRSEHRRALFQQGRNLVTQQGALYTRIRKLKGVDCQACRVTIACGANSVVQTVSDRKKGRKRDIIFDTVVAQLVPAATTCIDVLVEPDNAPASRFTIPVECVVDGDLHRGTLLQRPNQRLGVEMVLGSALSAKADRSALGRGLLWWKLHHMFVTIFFHHDNFMSRPQRVLVLSFSVLANMVLAALFGRYQYTTWQQWLGATVCTALIMVPAQHAITYLFYLHHRQAVASEQAWARHFGADVLFPRTSLYRFRTGLYLKKPLSSYQGDVDIDKATTRRPPAPGTVLERDRAADMDRAYAAANRGVVIHSLAYMVVYALIGACVFTILWYGIYFDDATSRAWVQYTIFGIAYNAAFLQHVPLLTFVLFKGSLNRQDTIMADDGAAVGPTQVPVVVGSAAARLMPLVVTNVANGTI